MARFIKKIQNFSSQYGLWEKGSRIIVGVSGGPDSVCLLDVLAFLSKKYEFELKIAHVNYGLRGQDSLRDEKFVKEIGKKYGFRVNILRPEKNQYKGNLENVLRNIRYKYFEKLRIEFGFDFVAVAHNQNDQAETVLMKILRGAGLNGLAAMRPKSGKIIRPFLQASRQDILSYLKEKDLCYRSDVSNEEVDILRNKIRIKLLPQLQKEYNSAIIETLAKFSFSIVDDYEFINEKAESFLKGVFEENKVVFFDKDFLSLSRSIQRQVLRRIFATFNFGLKDITFNQVEEIIKVIKSDKKKSKKALIGGLKISKKGAKIEILREIK